MTNEEAIKMLRTIKRTVYLGNRKFEDAIDEATSALEGMQIILDAGYTGKKTRIYIHGRLFEFRELAQ